MFGSLVFSRSAVGVASHPSFHLREGIAVFLASAVAHATQWTWNLPQLQRGGRAGGAAWDVLRGPMLRIFIVDGTCALLNAGALALYL
jgi:predicted RNA-binding Zn ribbon-like protein